MQIYAAGGKRLGERSKSYMAEFSTNPDERLKSEVSYSDHQKRLKVEADERAAYRIEVNKLRYKNNLETFKNQDKFEELIDDCGLQDDELFEFLINYAKVENEEL